MRRYWVELDQIRTSEVHFEAEVFHHIFDVCRQDVGAKFEVISSDSKAYFVEVISKAKKSAVARILESRTIQALPRPRLHLALSISRFPVMDAVIEKSVELGVCEIHPFYSDFSFLRKEDSISDSKIERWKKIVVSATQQSGRGDLMQMRTAIHLKELLPTFNRNPDTKGLFCYEGGTKDGISTVGIKSALKVLRDNQPNLENLWLFVGSEGGFSDQEVSLFAQHDLSPITLGNQVLRVETACITLVSVLKYEFDLMR